MINKNDRLTTAIQNYVCVHLIDNIDKLICRRSRLLLFFVSTYFISNILFVCTNAPACKR
jgi:hypothetical protein